MKKYLIIMLLSPSLFSLEKNMLHCDDIELFFISPANGFTTSESQLKVQFGSKNVFISPAGVEVERLKDCNVSGHHHLIINRSYDVREYAELPIYIMQGCAREASGAGGEPIIVKQAQTYF